MNYADIRESLSRMRQEANRYKWLYRLSYGLTILSFLSIFTIPLTVILVILTLLSFTVFFILGVWSMCKFEDIKDDIEVIILCSTLYNQNTPPP